MIISIIHRNIFECNITISISHLNNEDNFIFVDRFAESFSSLLHDISILIFLNFTFLLHLTNYLISYFSDVDLMFLLELLEEMGT